MAENFANNARSTLSADVSAGALSLTVTNASSFPAANFRLLVDSEIMIVTAKAGTTFTVTRGAESTTAAFHASGTPCYHTLTAGGLAAAGLGGAAGGDLSGTYPNPTVAKINTVSLGTTTATAGNVLVGDGSAWQTKPVSGDATLASTGALTLANSGASAATYGSATQSPQIAVDVKGRITSAANVTITGTVPGGSASGDLSGTYPGPTVAKINGATLGSTTATSGNVLIADGSSWVTKAVSGDATLASSGALTLANSGVTANSYGSATQVATFTVDAKGRLTAASNTSINLGNKTFYVYYRAGVVQNGTATMAFSTSAATPTAAVVTTSNTLLAAVSFANGADSYVQDHFTLPDDWASGGTFSVEIRWRNTTNDNTKNVVWSCQTAGANDGATYDPSFNAAQTATTAVTAGATRPITLTTISSLTTTGLVAGKEFFWKIGRVGTSGSDTLAESAELLSIKFTLQRTF